MHVPLPLFLCVRYDALLETLNLRRAERDRVLHHLARCKDDNRAVSPFSLISEIFRTTYQLLRIYSRSCRVKIKHIILAMRNQRTYTG